MKRLYIGGLSHSITEKDLRDRFGKFGEVSGVEIITRKDEDGAPQKTFGYVNINISDADYKKCVTVLNKSKWKGGTLQIELAKESFLHRLAEERQQAAVKLQTPKIDAQQKIVESLKAAGVENFHMKAAVPGTEIPGHKNWVVSKFGRVLPVLHLKCQDKNKVLKYDPSKHCHNIKKLDAEDDFTPVSRLTWQIDGGDDEISKKRRGEFPPQKKPQSRLRPALDLSSVLYSTAASENRTWTGRGGDDLSVNAGRPAPVRVLDSDADSEDEIRMMVAQERFRRDKSASTEDDGNLEVVGDEFVVKNKFWGTEENSINEEEYDSADTDEILTQNKKPSKPEETDTGSAPKSTSKVKREKSIRKDPTAPGTESDDDSESLDSDYEAMMGNCHKLSISLADLQDLVENMNEEASESDDAKDEAQAGPSDSSKRETKKAPSKGDINPEDILASLFGEDDEKEEISKVKKSTIPAFVGTKDLFGSGVLPSEPGLKRGAEKVHCETTEAKRLKSSTKMLETHQEAASKKSVFKSKIEEQGELSDTTSSSDEMELGEEPKRNRVASKPDVTSSKNASKANSMHKGPASSPSSSLMDQEETISSSSSTSSEESTTSDEDEDEDTTSVQRVSGSSVSPAIQQNLSDPLKQQLDNQKRLAAVEQRQKEAEEQKRLIQGALSKVDLPNASKGKHIVFDSDDDDGTENPPSQNKSLFDDESDEDGSEEQDENTEKEFRKPGDSKLFDSSEEEDEGIEEDRFKIKPQFEGKAGQKLMELQSRFGTDPRFQMDAKFLENEEEQDQDGGSVQSAGEQELVEEKKKNLEILQSVLNISLQPSDANKAATKGKTFKDVSALHYDPTSEAHTAFETKAETPKQESKAERRKKRKEAEKLPEVSKEIFYNVTGDLKEAFGTVKETLPEEEEEEEVTWDKEEEENEEETAVQDVSVVSFTANSETDQDVSGGFKFSFFGDDAVKQTSKPDEYKVETLKGAKVSWQVDPRFQDSSSDEEDEEETEEKEQEASASVTTTEQMAPTKPYFFFFDGDIRLKEGPGMFYRREKLEDLREAWEERRETLRVEFRKKHKDAKKRHKATMKT